jgi:hypothetical protein
LTNLVSGAVNGFHLDGGGESSAMDYTLRVSRETGRVIGAAAPRVWGNGRPWNVIMTKLASPGASLD